MNTVGVERERYIVDQITGYIVPEIGNLLPIIQRLAEQSGVDAKRFTYELFAGQVEDKTPPCFSLAEIAKELTLNDAILEEAAFQLGVMYEHAEFIEECRIASLEVNPFDSRHQGIWQSLPNHVRLAASAVAAVHVHVQVDQELAVMVLNRCRADVIDRLISLGDRSAGKRISSYRQMAGTQGVPPLFGSFAEIADYINSKGGEKNVWDLVRYKPSTQTIEFRMFGATSVNAEILEYIQACLDIIG